MNKRIGKSYNERSYVLQDIPKFLGVVPPYFKFFKNEYYPEQKDGKFFQYKL